MATHACLARLLRYARNDWELCSQRRRAFCHTQKFRCISQVAS